MFKAAGKPCLELQDALSKQMPPEIHHKMLPASRTIALTMRTAVEKADAVVKERRRVLFPDGRGLLDKLACLVGPSREYVSSTGKCATRASLFPRSPSHFDKATVGQSETVRHDVHCRLHEAHEPHTGGVPYAKQTSF